MGDGLKVHISNAISWLSTDVESLEWEQIAHNVINLIEKHLKN